MFSNSSVAVSVASGVSSRPKGWISHCRPISTKQARAGSSLIVRLVAPGEAAKMISTTIDHRADFVYAEDRR
jgi:hypothetical protein